MTNPVEAITNILKTFTDDEPKPALHVGEVMSLWTTMTAFFEAQSLYQIGLNMTNDTDLKHALEKALQGSNADTQRIHEFLKEEGVPIPTGKGEKTKSNPDDVPEGVKLTNEEIANLISVKTATSITMCAQAMTTSIRSDVGLIFIQSMVNLMNYATSLKNLMKARGWLKQPPPYLPPGTPNT